MPRAIHAELIVWDAVTGKELRTMQSPTLPGEFCYRVVFSQNRTRMAVAILDQEKTRFRIYVADVESGQELFTLNEQDQNFTFSSDGKLLALPFAECGAKVWDATSGRELLTLNGHTHQIVSLAFSPDGRWIASGSYDKTVKLWDVASGKEQQTLKGHTQEVFCVAFSPDGKQLASSSMDETIKVWQIRVHP